jgi:exopolysaccharide biosynthesis polyprenyl glycosylphosphotransferase
MKSWQLPKGVIWYAVADYLAALLSWVLFVLVRRMTIEGRPFDERLFQDSNFLYSLLVVPVVWMLVYVIVDSYHHIYRLSRLTEFSRTLLATFLGSLLLFFTILLDDLVNYLGGYQGYYRALASLMGIHLLCSASVRMLILTLANRRIRSGRYVFNTLVIGQHPDSLEVYQDISTREEKLGYNVVGYLTTPSKKAAPLEGKVPHLGKLKDLRQVLVKHHIEEVILALEPYEERAFNRLIAILEQHTPQILLRAIPEMRPLLLGQVNIPRVRGADLLEIKTHLIPIWLRITKRTIDVATSILVLLLLSPLYIFVAIKVRLSSDGPVFYKQERIGRHGRPFLIYKFRSMYLDAEKGGPQLSSDTDDRCTPWGRTMRKYRLDEIPQFWNVLKGDMSLVGPRPERQFYIDQIAKRDPRVHLLHKVRPGITSWGQVQYGYASNVDEMVDRLQLDLIYIENLTLGLDIKIIIHTIFVIIKGSGK